MDRSQTFSIKVEHTRQPRARGESWVYTVSNSNKVWGVLVDERVRSRTLFESSRHEHDRWDEAIVPLEGSYWVSVDSWSRTVCPGEAAIIPGGLTHESGIANNPTGAHFLVLLVSKDHGALRDVEAGGVMLPSGALSWLRAAFRMLRYAATPSNFIPLSVLPEFIRAIGSQPRLPSDGSHPDPLVAQVIRMIREAEVTLSLQELARNVGLTPFHLQRRFKGVTGTSPLKFAQAFRLEAVSNALKEGSTLALADLAAEHGFNDLKHFRRLFKRRFGVSPSDHRKNDPPAQSARAYDARRRIRR